jgi:Flp pilus assembly protein TadB
MVPGYSKAVRAEDAEKRRLRQLAETAGSLAPSRIGAWTTPGYVHGDSWSDLPWLGRLAFVIVLVALAAVAVLIAVAAGAGPVGAVVVIAACVVLPVSVVSIGRARRRRLGRSARRGARDRD